MKQNTKDRLLEFIDQVCILAQGSVHMTGTEDCGKLLRAATALRWALEHDDSIKE